MLRTSIEGRLTAFAALVAIAAAVSVAWLAGRSGALWLAIVVALPWSIVGAALLSHLIWRPHQRSLNALADGLERLADRDFSAGLSAHDPSLRELISSFNTLVDAMRSERQTLFQRELLLDTVLQASPLALMLTASGGRVIYSNAAARRLFCEGSRIDGRLLSEVLANGPAGLAEVIREQRDGLCTVEVDDQPEVFHVSRREFTLNAQRHSLYLVKLLTQEISRQEVATWKRVIRVISHELNNSLAPMRSLANSGRQMVGDAGDGPRERLELVFDTIVDRAEHLSGFIQGYARFAKLPAPRRQRIDWAELMQMLSGVVTFRQVGEWPSVAVYADAAQLEQVLINLLKNAHESGSPADAIEVEVGRASGDAVTLQVRDRGQGMSAQTLASALLPFYSTKRAGTGLGLALCREIVEAHGGRLQLANRAQGGLEVTIRLPCGRPPLPSEDETVTS
jgi:two-component system nitrogen regulation sensor histidine kinase NtrY